MYRYEFTPEARNKFIKLTPEIRKIITKKLEYFLSSGQPLIFAGHLTNHKVGQYRFRIGDYRVIFDVEGESLVILSVGHRREIYK